jgi:hypothetical protein
MSNEEVAPETKGVTAELLTTVDLGPEIEGMAGQQLRMRMWASSGLTDIHHQGHSPGKDVQNGDHGTEEDPSSSVVHPGVQG